MVNVKIYLSSYFTFTFLLFVRFNCLTYHVNINRTSRYLFIFQQFLARKSTSLNFYGLFFKAESYKFGLKGYYKECKQSVHVEVMNKSYNSSDIDNISRNVTFRPSSSINDCMARNLVIR